MTRSLVLPAALLVALTACGATGDRSGLRDDAQPTDASTTDAASSVPTTASPPECETLTDPATGQSLCEFEDAASYPYRLAAAKDVDNLLLELRAIAPWLEESDLGDVYEACADLDRDIPADARTQTAVTRFSGGAGEQVTPAQATELLAVADRLVCKG